MSGRIVLPATQRNSVDACQRFSHHKDKRSNICSKFVETSKRNVTIVWRGWCYGSKSKSYRGLILSVSWHVRSKFEWCNSRLLAIYIHFGNPPRRYVFDILMEYLRNNYFNIVGVAMITSLTTIICTNVPDDVPAGSKQISSWCMWRTSRCGVVQHLSPQYLLRPAYSRQYLSALEAKIWLFACR